MGYGEELKKYLSRSDVPLGMRINTLIQVNPQHVEFVKFGEMLIESASFEEKKRLEKQISELEYFIRMRQMRLDSG